MAAAALGSGLVGLLGQTRARVDIEGNRLKLLGVDFIDFVEFDSIDTIVGVKPCHGSGVTLAAVVLGSGLVGLLGQTRARIDVDGDRRQLFCVRG